VFVIFVYQKDGLQLNISGELELLSFNKCNMIYESIASCLYYLLVANTYIVKHVRALLAVM